MQEDLKIHEDCSKYRLKLSKNSGLPDLDLPAISQELKIREANEKVFSVVVDDSTTVYKSQTISQFKVEEAKNEKDKPLIDDSNKRSSGCCMWIKNLFSKSQ